MHRLLFFALVIASCSDEREARRTLDAAGLRNVEITGWSPMSCAKDDLTSTGFRADNSAGKRIEGVVCCGILKGCTVRY